MLCDSVANYHVTFFVCQGSKRPEDKDAIQKHGLAYTVVTKLLKIGNYMSKDYHIFMDNFSMTVPLAKDMCKLCTYMTRTIRRNRKFLPQAFRSKFEVDEKNIFTGAQILLLPFVKNSHSSCAATPPTARQKILNTLVCVMDNLLENLPLHRATVILWGQ